MAAAKLQQEGVHQVGEQVWEFVILVHLFHEELDGAQRLQGEGLVDSTLTNPGESNTCLCHSPSVGPRLPGARCQLWRWHLSWR